MQRLYNARHRDNLVTSSHTKSKIMWRGVMLLHIPQSGHLKWDLLRLAVQILECWYSQRMRLTIPDGLYFADGAKAQLQTFL
ncbi:hypothetical protein [Coleofasciculus sp.]|uniref:hypothetical protein n=1 Tax=Coleofasciculus sp. TaxID=3100458 RepID=UPI003A2DE3E6